MIDIKSDGCVLAYNLKNVVDGALQIAIIPNNWLELKRIIIHQLGKHNCCRFYSVTENSSWGHLESMVYIPIQIPDVENCTKFIVQCECGKPLNKGVGIFADEYINRDRGKGEIDIDVLTLY